MDLTVIISILGLVINFGALLIIWRQLTINSKQVMVMKEAYLADHERRKKQSTIEYVNSIRGFYRPLVDKLDQKFGKNHVINISDMNEYDKKDIREILSVVEHMAVGVETEVYDIDMIDRMSWKYFLRMRRVLGPYIDDAQKRSPDNYVEFDRMCDRLNQKRKNLRDNGKLVYPIENS